MKQPLQKHTAYFELLEAFQKAPGCAICGLTLRGTHRYMDSLLYESVTDGGMRARLIKSKGFCPRHARFLLEYNDALGTALLYEDQLQLGLDFLQHLRKTERTPGNAWNEHEECPACRVENEGCGFALSTLRDWIDDSELRSAIEAGSGLCMPHLVAAVNLVQESCARRFLLDAHLAKLTGLLMELKEFIRKNDYRFQGKGFGHERDSWRRAVKMLVGDVK